MVAERVSRVLPARSGGLPDDRSSHAHDSDEPWYGQRDSSLTTPRSRRRWRRRQQVLPFFGVGVQDAVAVDVVAATAAA